LLCDHRGFRRRGLRPGHDDHQMGRGVGISKCPLRAITALLAATLAVLIDPIFRCNDYRTLLQ
jgi:hypothetical protein